MEQIKQLTGGQGLGVALVLFSTLCLSTEAIAAKIAYRGGATVMTALTLRYILAAAVFWLLALAGRHACRLPARQFLAVAALSLGAQTLTVLALFEAFRLIPAAMAILLLYFFPAIVAILAFFFLDEPLTWRKGLAILLTFTGCAFILGQPLNTLEFRGILLSLAAALTNAVFMVGVARLLKDIETPVFNAYFSTIVAVAVGILGLARGELSLAFDFQASVAIVVLGIVTTVLAMAALLRGIKQIGASRASIISTFEPVATALLGFMVLGEMLSARQIAGGLVVLAGVFILRKTA